MRFSLKTLPIVGTPCYDYIMNENGNLLSLDHLFTFEGYGTMTGQRWVFGLGGHYGDFERDEVEHALSCWCQPSVDTDPPF